MADGTTANASARLPDYEARTQIAAFAELLSGDELDVLLDIARGLIAGAAQLDDGEFLEVISATPAELRAGVRRGEITDAKTLSCMVWLDALERGEWQPQWMSGDIDLPR